MNFEKSNVPWSSERTEAGFYKITAEMYLNFNNARAPTSFIDFLQTRIESKENKGKGKTKKYEHFSYIHSRLNISARKIYRSLNNNI